MNKAFMIHILAINNVVALNVFRMQNLIIIMHTEITVNLILIIIVIHVINVHISLTLLKANLRTNLTITRSKGKIILKMNQSILNNHQDRKNRLIIKSLREVEISLNKANLLIKLT